jgi:hypothetical protein
LNHSRHAPWFTTQTPSEKNFSPLGFSPSNPAYAAFQRYENSNRWAEATLTRIESWRSPWWGLERLFSPAAMRPVFRTTATGWCSGRDSNQHHPTILRSTIQSLGAFTFLTNKLKTEELQGLAFAPKQKYKKEMKI